MSGPGPGQHAVAFPSGVDVCAGVLTLPDGPGPHPALVMGHGFGMTMDCRLEAFATAFAAAGIASLRFDYRGFGASGGLPRQVLDVDAQRDDYRAALAHVRGLTEVDPARVGLWGTSFSGGHVLAVAADDPDLAVVVAQVPFTDGPSTVRGEGVRVAAASIGPGEHVPVPGVPALPGGGTGDGDGGALRWALHSAALLGRATLDAARGRLGLAPLLVPVAGELGSGAVIAGPGTLEQLRVLVPDDVPWRNAVAARVALRLPRERPGGLASRITAPLLVCVCEHDRVTPPAPAVAAARAAADGTLRVFPFAHFDAYVPPGRDALVAAELAWLRPRLGLV